MPSTTALVQAESDQNPTLKQQAVELPALGAKQLYVDVEYAAQNPVDIQSLDGNAFGDGAVLGCDFVGRVAEVGKEVTRYKVGDHIAGLVFGGEIKGKGAYSKRTIADENISFPVPASFDPAEAATVPLACCTAWLALFSKECLGIDRKQASNSSVLIWGGSSSVGLYAIQLASLYNINVVTTCSPSNFELVKSMGAKHAFDYKDDDVVDKIKSAVPDVGYVFDTIGTKNSSPQGSEAAGADKAVLTTVRPGAPDTEKVKKGVKVTDVLVFTAFLKEHAYGEIKYPTSHEHHALSSELYEKLPGLLESGKIKPSKVKAMSGLDAVEEGFGLYRDGKISAFKLVYKL